MVVVTINPNPTVDFTWTDGDICPGSEVGLTAFVTIKTEAPYSYTWTGARETGTGTAKVTVAANRRDGVAVSPIVTDGNTCPSTTPVEQLIVTKNTNKSAIGTIAVQSWFLQAHRANTHILMSSTLCVGVVRTLYAKS